MASAAGTSRQGFVRTTYGMLHAAFGEPTYRWPETDKAAVEWVLEIAGETVTIYDYTGGQVNFEMARSEPYSWHVGGFGPSAVAIVSEALTDVGVEHEVFGVGSTVAVPSGGA